MTQGLCIGIDLGTSGCRAVAVDRAGEVRGRADAPLPAPLRDGAAVEQAAALWWEVVRDVLRQMLDTLTAPVAAIAVDGTSGTVLLTDAVGQPLSPALMYNDNRATEQAARIAGVAPRDSAAHGTGSGLAKLLWLLERSDAPEPRVHTQADWVAGRLTGRYGSCDANNALKLGYDPVTGRWPVWLADLGVEEGLLPMVVTPGTPLGPIDPALAAELGFPPETLITAGTTDSTAAILATGITRPGEAVTSLGSTLVTKVLSERPVSAPEYGVYSQPFGDHWLVGGGSNSGGAVLRQFFDDARMAELTPRLRPGEPTGLDYYPLPVPGERFPVNDPALVPRMAPRPSDDVTFFQGMLEGMARIERDAYRRLAELGAPSPTEIYTVGGGAANRAWTEIRERIVGVPMLAPEHTDAAYGTALLALRAVCD